MLRRIFGGHPDSVLRPMREIIRNSTAVFPYKDIIEKLRGTNRSLIFSEDDIRNLLSYKYGQNYTFSVLVLLYPNLDYRRNKFHQDHIFPKSFFTSRELFNRRNDLIFNKLKELLSDEKDIQ